VLCRGATSVRTYNLQRATGEDTEVAFTDRQFIPLFPKASHSDDGWHSPLLQKLINC
jgi:hypothetical protein